MKYVLTLPILLFFFACNLDEQTAKGLLKNDKMQKEILDEIAADSALSAQMLDRMMENKKSQMVMQNHIGVSRMMCNAQRLDSIVKVDKEMDKIMLTFVHCRLDQDSSWCRKLSKIIQDKDNTRTGVKKVP